LDPDAELGNQNTLSTITVRKVLARLQSVTKNQLLTGIERTRGGGTLLLFGAQLASQVEEATRNVTVTLEEITGRKLSRDFKETHGIGENDSRRDEPSDSSEMDNTLMQSVMSGITEREGVSASAGSNVWGNPPSQIFIEPEYQNAHINVTASLSTVTNAAAVSTPSTENELRAQHEELRKLVLDLQSRLPSAENVSKPYTQIVSGNAQEAPAEKAPRPTSSTSPTSSRKQSSRH
jgi:hypothetical protein